MESVGLRRVRVALAVWLFGVFAYFVPAATWNPVSRFSLTRAIVEEHTFVIDAYAESTGDRARRADHWYSDKAPVPSLLAVAPYALVHTVQALQGKTPSFRALGTPDFPARRVYVNASFRRGLYACSAFTAGLAGALLGVLVFEVLRRRIAARHALGAAMLTMLGSPLFPYATSFYGHVVAAAFLFAGVMALHESSPATISRSRAAWAGAALVLAAGSEYLVFGPALVAWLAAVVRAARPSPRRALSLVAWTGTGGAIPGAIIGAYHAVCFGAPWRTGYGFIVREEFARGHATGIFGVQLPSPRALAGILFSADRGLFVLAPVLLIATVAGLVALAKRRRAFDATSAGVALTLLLLNGGYYMWWGGASAGPRHVIPALPFLGLGLGAALARRPWSLVSVALGALSVLNMLAIASVGLEAPETGSVLVDYAWMRALNGQLAQLSGASNLAVELGLPRAASMGPLLAWMLVGSRLVYRELDPADAERVDHAREA